MSRRILVAGGGTGGHLFPGIAVLEELRRRLDVDPLFVGTARGIEARVIPERGEKLELLEVAPLKGQSVGALFGSLGKLPRAISRAAAVVRAHQAELVLGVGGYASGPVLAAAAAMGVPTALLEQNAHVGLTNKMLAKVVGRAYVSFEETREVFGKKARVVGNPVRADLAAWARRASADPMGFEARAERILVLGGSQGAKALNETVPAGLAKLAPTLKALGLSILHQTGAAMRDEVAARYRELGLEAEVVPFIDDMAHAYTSAAFVIARAGATTLAELQAIGRPSILIPFPFAADDHQTKNAGALAAAGAAIAIAQDALTPESLAEALAPMLADPSARRAMAEAARRRGRPDAAASIVDDLCEWLGWDEAVRPSVPVVAAPIEPSRDEEEDEEDDEPPQRASLRGERYYEPGFRRSVYPAARRPLVFDGAFAWE
ncbi:MAG: undecaprenyldiphospho-muramoylpentapeptide beta-N-acetylglucosaminyltransferase [Myxococcales bacterium]|nr:undecaprenyldiphospho-muramoylpentapeptide beta-N-acetylglucosaminyltransferase [Myxococcales bacterium]